MLLDPMRVVSFRTGFKIFKIKGSNLCNLDVWEHLYFRFLLLN